MNTIIKNIVRPSFIKEERSKTVKFQVRPFSEEERNQNLVHPPLEIGRREMFCTFFFASGHRGRANVVLSTPLRIPTYKNFVHSTNRKMANLMSLIHKFSV